MYVCMVYIYGCMCVYTHFTSHLVPLWVENHYPREPTQLPVTMSNYDIRQIICAHVYCYHILIASVAPGPITGDL